MKLVHAADIHLDSALRGLDRIGERNAEEVRGATRRALENLVELVRRERADLLVIAGDLYDGDWNDYSTGQFFLRQMETLADVGVPVVIASGNHDAASQITRSLRFPPHVRMLGAEAPDTVHFDDLDVVVHGQSYARRDVQQNLAAAFPRRAPGRVNIGVLHTSVGGYDGVKTYAPCSRADLEGLQYHYLALGHIHARQPVIDGDHPAWFSGNLQGRHARETGPKGALVVDLDVDRPAEVGFRALDHVRWERLTVDVTGLATSDDVLDAIGERVREAQIAADGRTLVARFVLQGTTPAAERFQDDEWALEELRSITEGSAVVVEKLEVRVGAPPLPDPDADEVRAAIAQIARELGEDPAGLKAIAHELERKFRDVALGDDDGLVTGIDLSHDGTLRDALGRALAGLDARLAGGPR